MKKVFLTVFIALMGSFLFAPAAFAKGHPGQSAPADPAPQTPAPAPVPGDDNPGQDDQSDQAGQAGQSDQSNQVPGEKAGCGLWKFIKKLMDKHAAKDAAELKKLLVIADKDLELCLNSISGKGKCYSAVFPAVEHLNHALHALGKCHPVKALRKPFKELEKRISHAKFYLIVYDFEEVQARIESARDLIGTLDD
ncbi:MAG: hypothetical protein WA705_14925 [Candidatus Ozemobacteraceae bacterium]